MRIGLSLLSLVALGEEIATVVQPPPPASAAPVVLNCAPELTRCVTKYETELKEVEARGLAKLQAELSTLNTRHATELNALKTQLAESSRQFTESQALVSSLQSKGSSEVTALKAAVAAAREEAEKATKAEASARVRQAAELGAAREALSKAEETSKLAEKRLESMQSELAVRGRQLGALEQKVTNFERVVFSRAHFEVMATNLKTIVYAVARNFRANVNSVFNVDVFELARLQGLLMYKRVQPYTSEVYERLQGAIESFEIDVRVQELWERGLPWAERLRSWTEAKMERVITSLSAADPQIRAMFPESFEDRFVAVLYLVTVFYMVKYVVKLIAGAVYGVLVAVFGPPIQYVHARMTKWYRQLRKWSSTNGAGEKRASKSVDQKLGGSHGETASSLKHRKG